MNPLKMLVALMMLGMGLGLAGLSAAADDAKESKGGDKQFAKKASACGLAEVNLSNLARTRAHNAAVRQFAQHMIRDHTKANSELVSWANAHAIPLARNMDEKHQKMFEKLSKLEGNEFDCAYIEGMVKDHEEAVQLFEKQSKEGKDETLKTWADNKLPALKQHLESARTVCKNVKGEKKGKDDSDR